MNLLHGFVAENPFYDDINYPHGFSRSGKFSIKEAEMLSQLGRRLIALESGSVRPETEEEKSFVAMCEQNKEAIHPVEKVWNKYKDSIKKQNFHTLNSSVKVAPSDMEDFGGDY